jgi:hypothetical protein
MKDYTMLPDHMQESARKYLEVGCHTGDFLHAVLSNNLVNAYRRADPDNHAAMHQWAQWLVNEVPISCWGSEEKIERHIQKGGNNGGC